MNTKGSAWEKEESAMNIETLLESVRSSLESRQYTTFVELFAEEGVYELPFAPLGAKAIYSGIESIRERFLEIANSPLNRLYDLQEVKPKSSIIMGGSGAVAELSIEGNLRSTGAKVAVSSSVAIIEIVGGKISRYRDYPNSIGIAQALGVLPEFLASLK